MGSMQDPYIPSPFLVGLPTCPLVAHSRGAARIDITTSLWMSFFDGGAQGKRKQCQPPLTEILYLPTGDSVRYKARVWIDAIGPRVFGCLGSSALYFTTRGDLRLLVLVWLLSFPPHHKITSLSSEPTSPRNQSNTTQHLLWIAWRGWF